MAMRIQFSLVLCLLSVDIMSAYGQPPRSTQLDFSEAPIPLTPPDAQVGQVANTRHPEVLPPSRTSANQIELVDFSEPVSRMPSGFEAMEHSDRLRIWNLPYGVWVATSDRDPAQPHCHLDPTGMSYLAYPSLGHTGEVTLYFARSSLDLTDPAHRFEKKVRLVATQTVDFDFAREGGNTGYGNTVKTSLFVQLPTPACETTRELPVAAATVVASMPRPVSSDDDAISSLLHCRDLDPNVFSDRISFASDLVVRPSEGLGNVRLCQIAIEGRDRTRLTDKWTLRGKLEVHTPAGTFVATDKSSALCELKVDVADLPTANDPDHKVLVLKETAASLQIKLRNPQLIDNTIYKHPLLDFLTLLSPATEGTIRLTDVKLKLNRVQLDDACTADVSAIQIHFVKE